MKKRRMLVSVFVLLCIVAVNVVCFPCGVSAKEITSARQAEKLAKKEVKGAVVIETDTDEEYGELVYEVELQKGAKQYDLVYRASDSKLISYKYDVKYGYKKKGGQKCISAGKCKKLAKKQARGAKITSVRKKYSDGVLVYKVKMKKGNKKYEMKIHAGTGKVLEYEWDLILKNKKNKNKNKQGNSDKDYDYDRDDGDDDNGHDETGGSANQGGQTISLAAAKEIAAADAGLSVSDVIFTEAKSDYEDGILVYEIEFCTSEKKYEYEIDAKDGTIRSKKSKDYTNGVSGGAATPASPTVSLAAAKEIAAADAGLSVSDVIFTEAKSDYEDGILVYEIEFCTSEKKYEYEINAQDGTIREKEAEYL